MNKGKKYVKKNGNQKDRQEQYIKKEILLYQRIAYADDVALIARNQKELKTIVTKLSHKSGKICSWIIEDKIKY